MLSCWIPVETAVAGLRLCPIRGSGFWWVLGCSAPRQGLFGVVLFVLPRPAPWCRCF